MPKSRSHYPVPNKNFANKFCSRIKNQCRSLVLILVVSANPNRDLVRALNHRLNLLVARPAPRKFTLAVLPLLTALAVYAR